MEIPGTFPATLKWSNTIPLNHSHTPTKLLLKLINYTPNDSSSEFLNYSPISTRELRITIISMHFPDKTWSKYNGARFTLIYDCSYESVTLYNGFRL